MRLTCPNCGAQYEVPDEVIPKDGRDVQCSNCGDTWFQGHPDMADQVAAASPEPGVDAVENASDDGAQSDAWDSDDLNDMADQLEAAQAATEPSEPEPQPEPEPEPAREPSTLDPAVADILRQEAAHEQEQRAAETGGNLESQPDLGLSEAPSDEAGRRAREARDRMTRIRGESPQTVDSNSETGARSDLLPDIEEINSTLRASGDSAAEQMAQEAAEQAQRGGGFARGFGLVVLITVILVVLYGNSDSISQTVPQAAPVLDSYVGLVDQGRAWLDSKAGTLLPN